MDLNSVDSIGVNLEVIDVVEEWRREQRRAELLIDMAVSPRDAEYIVHCLRVLLHDEHMAERLILCLFFVEISDEAIDVFAVFLRETPCHLHSLYLWELRPRQIHRLLASLHTNTSVKRLCIRDLQDSEGALWIAELLRHKKDFEILEFPACCLGDVGVSLIFCELTHGDFSAMKKLNLAGNQITSFGLCFLSRMMMMNAAEARPRFQELNFNMNPHLFSPNELFNYPESTQLFVDALLLSPYTTLKTLGLHVCGVSLENPPLMAGFHKNTTLVELGTDQEEVRLFIEPILRRNLYLGHVHGMLGTRTTTTLLPMSLTVPSTGVGMDIIVPTTPPPCGLWTSVLAKVGQGTQGASPVFAILRDRLATWMIPPSPQNEQQQPERRQHQHSCPVSLAFLQPPKTTLVASKVNHDSAPPVGLDSTTTTTTSAAMMTTDSPSNAKEEQHHDPRHLGQKRAASKSDDSTASKKIPKSSPDI